MLKPLALAATLAASTLAQVESGTIGVHNNCDFPVLRRIDGPNGFVGETLILGPGAESMNIPLLGEGQSLKFVTEANPNWDQPIQFAYSVPPNSPPVWYGVSYNVPNTELPFAVFAVPHPLDCQIAGCPADAKTFCGVTRTCKSDAPIDVFLCFNPVPDLEARQRMRTSAKIGRSEGFVPSPELAEAAL